MHYRLYQATDFPQIYAIEEICFPPPLRFSRAYMRWIIDRPSSATWVAEDETTIVGFAIVEWADAPADPLAYIQTLEVAPESRRRGVARELLRKLESSADAAGASQIWLHVDVENASAKNLYRAHGYQLRGREENYYARRHAAEIYAKPLPAHS